MCERDRDRDRCVMCVGQSATEKHVTNRSSLPPLLLSIFSFISSSCHSPRPIFSPPVVITSSLLFFTSLYVHSVRADYKSKQKFVSLPPL